MTDKKSQQLGMNYSTAAGRLSKDILWNFIQTTGKEVCCKCGGLMTRETFSIEHLTPWQDSEDPVGLFYSLDNIGYSHLRCNISAARKTRSPRSKNDRKAEGQRKKYAEMTTEERRANRRERYEKYGY